MSDPKISSSSIPDSPSWSANKSKYCAC